MSNSAKYVLLVEDNPTDEKLTVRALRSSDLGNEIVVVRDGQAALDWCFASGAHADRDATHLPTVVLLDLKLPRIDGLEVLRRIRADARTRAVPVVVLTSSMQDEDLAAAYALGANAYVRKPVDFAAFVAAAKTLGSFWLTLNELPPADRAR